VAMRSTRLATRSRKTGLYQAAPSTPTASRSPRTEMSTARVIGWSAEEAPLVSLRPGAMPIPARVSHRVTSAALHGAITQGWEAVVMMVNGDPRQLVVVDVILPLSHPDHARRLATNQPGDLLLQVRDEGSTVVLDATDPGTSAVSLRCGDASVTLARDGTVAIRGVDIVARAKQTFWIRSGATRLN